jgi:hypothetical protein
LRPICDLELRLQAHPQDISRVIYTTNARPITIVPSGLIHIFNNDPAMPHHPFTPSPHNPDVTES